MHAMWSSKQFRRPTTDWSRERDRQCRRMIRANRPNRTVLRVCIVWWATSDIRCSQMCPAASTDRSFYDGIEINFYFCQIYIWNASNALTFCSIFQYRTRCWCNSAHIWRNLSHSLYSQQIWQYISTDPKCSTALKLKPKTKSQVLASNI